MGMSSRSCIFCAIISGKQQSTQVYRDPNFVVIMDKYPINVGHTLIIPTKHYEDLFRMPPA
ncbi:MAG: HIT family protein, partial [Nitrososphaera sp.]